MALQIDDNVQRQFTQPMSQHHHRLQDGKYRIARTIHITGARSLLWGHQRELDRSVLIERIAGLREAQVSQVLACRQTLLTLEHPHLARCTDIFVEDGALYLILVAGAGQTLAEMTSMMPPTTSIATGIALCNMLNFARRQPGLHQDIAIDPFMAYMTKDGRIKLTNLAALIGIITPRYRSRFVGTGGTSASRAVFSIGATLHCQLTGWTGVYRDGAPGLATLRPDLPIAYCQTIMRALHPDPAERWADSMALRYALLPLLGA